MPQPDSPTIASTSPRLDHQIDLIDGTERPARPQHAAADREDAADAAAFENDVAAGHRAAPAKDGSRDGASGSPSRRQRDARPGPRSRNGTGAAAQAGSAWAQRPRN